MEKRRERVEERKQDGTCTPWWGSWSRGEIPEFGETPSPMGKPPLWWGNRLGQKHLRLSEEGEAANQWQTGKSEKYTDGPYCGPTWHGLALVFTGVQGGWELKNGDWRTGLERELLLAVGTRTEGMEGRKTTTENAYGGRPDCHGSRSLLLNHMQGWNHYCSLSLPTCWLLLMNNKRSPLRVGSHAPAAKQ